jgi:hypothetical protein
MQEREATRIVAEALRPEAEGHRDFQSVTSPPTPRYRGVTAGCAGISLPHAIDFEFEPGGRPVRVPEVNPEVEDFVTGKYETGAALLGALRLLAQNEAGAGPVQDRRDEQLHPEGYSGILVAGLEQKGRKLLE